MATTKPTGHIRPARPDNLTYGSPADVTQLLDGVGRILREEDQDQWDDVDLREATEALRGHLTWRLDNYARRMAR